MLCVVLQEKRDVISAPKAQARAGVRCAITAAATYASFSVTFNQSKLTVLSVWALLGFASAYPPCSDNTRDNARYADCCSQGMDDALTRSGGLTANEQTIAGLPQASVSHAFHS